MDFGVEKISKFHFTGWWVSGVFLIFAPIPGEMIQFDLRIFFRWIGEKPPTNYLYIDPINLGHINVGPYKCRVNFGSTTN